MYSTKLTVSHSICSELTPQKETSQLSLSFCPFLLHSKSFSSNKVVKSTQCASPCTYYVQTKMCSSTSLCSKLSRLDFNIYFHKKKEESGLGEKLRLLLSERLSGDNLKSCRIQHYIQLNVYIKKYAMQEKYFIWLFLRHVERW